MEVDSVGLRVEDGYFTPPKQLDDEMRAFCESKGCPYPRERTRLDISVFLPYEVRKGADDNAVVRCVRGKMITTVKNINEFFATSDFLANLGLRNKLMSGAADIATYLAMGHLGKAIALSVLLHPADYRLVANVLMDGRRPQGRLVASCYPSLLNSVKLLCALLSLQFGATGEPMLCAEAQGKGVVHRGRRRDIVFDNIGTILLEESNVGGLRDFVPVSFIQIPVEITVPVSTPDVVSKVPTNSNYYHAAYAGGGVICAGIGDHDDSKDWPTDVRSYAKVWKDFAEATSHPAYNREYWQGSIQFRYLSNTVIDQVDDAYLEACDRYGWKDISFHNGTLRDVNYPARVRNDYEGMIQSLSESFSVQELMALGGYRKIGDKFYYCQPWGVTGIRFHNAEILQYFNSSSRVRLKWEDYDQKAFRRVFGYKVSLLANLLAFRISKSGVGLMPVAIMYVRYYHKEYGSYVYTNGPTVRSLFVDLRAYDVDQALFILVVWFAMSYRVRKAGNELKFETRDLPVDSFKLLREWSFFAKHGIYMRWC